MASVTSLPSICTVSEPSCIPVFASPTWENNWSDCIKLAVIVPLALILEAVTFVTDIWPTVSKSTISASSLIYKCSADSFALALILEPVTFPSIAISPDADILPLTSNSVLGSETFTPMLPSAELTLREISPASSLKFQSPLAVLVTEASSCTSLSIYPVPSTYKSFHSWASEPKS